MNKPLSMVINETRILLTNTCNQSGLPACVLEPIIKELYDEIKRISAIQLMQDEECYAESQKMDKNGENKPTNENKQNTEPR